MTRAASTTCVGRRRAWRNPPCRNLPCCHLAPLLPCPLCLSQAHKKLKLTSWKRPTEAANPATAPAVPSSAGSVPSPSASAAGSVSSAKSAPVAAEAPAPAPAAAPEVEEPLPEGWKQFTNDKGRVYYVRAGAASTAACAPAYLASRQPPPPSLPARAPPLPRLQAHKKLKLTSWKRPTEAANPATALPLAPVVTGISPGPSADGTPSVKPGEPPLPPGWKSFVNDKGRTYYAHKAKKLTSWKRPTAENDPAAGPPAAAASGAPPTDEAPPAEAAPPAEMSPPPAEASPPPAE